MKILSYTSFLLALSSAFAASSFSMEEERMQPSNPSKSGVFKSALRTNFGKNLEEKIEIRLQDFVKEGFYKRTSSYFTRLNDFHVHFTLDEVASQRFLSKLGISSESSQVDVVLEENKIDKSKPAFSDFPSYTYDIVLNVFQYEYDENNTTPFNGPRSFWQKFSISIDDLYKVEMDSENLSNDFRPSVQKVASTKKKTGRF